MLCVADFEACARQALDKKTWEFYAGGADGEQTLRDNVEAYSRYRIRPRVLRDVSSVDMKTCLLGEEVAFPIAVSPTAFHRMAHPDGELATARACTQLDTCYVLSTWTTSGIAEVAEASGSGLRWFQLALYTDKELVLKMVRQAEQLGFKALLLTVDTPILGRRLASIRNQFSPPSDAFASFKGTKLDGVLSEGGSAFLQYARKLANSSQSWEGLDWLRSQTKLPIVLKGILTAEDVEEALKHDIQGIMVSNHGGRQLDGVPATIDALGEVVRAVQGRVEVYMDGGVRQGTDVLKALAMGAKAVFIGRPVLWGLAYKGEEGVTQVLQILRDELKVAMMLSGCSSLQEIKPELVVHQSYYKI